MPSPSVASSGAITQAPVRSAHGLSPVRLYLSRHTLAPVQAHYSARRAVLQVRSSVPGTVTTQLPRGPVAKETEPLYNRTGLSALERPIRRRLAVWLPKAG